VAAAAVVVLVEEGKSNESMLIFIAQYSAQSTPQLTPVNISF